MDYLCHQKRHFRPDTDRKSKRVRITTSAPHDPLRKLWNLRYSGDISYLPSRLSNRKRSTGSISRLLRGVVSVMKSAILDLFFGFWRFR